MTDSYRPIQLNSWLKSAEDSLKSAGISSARLDSELIAGFCFGESREWVHGHPEFQISLAIFGKLTDLLNRRISHEPIAYLLGEKEFYGRCFYVNKNVLVPRPETESLIELALSVNLDRPRLIDIGTGSGNIGISIMLERPKWRAHLTDISSRALELTAKNIRQFKLEETITFRKQNLLRADDTDYSIVVANLPYVPDSLSGSLDLMSEPAISLFAGNDGLDLYRELFKQINKRKLKPLHLITESLVSQHKDMQEMASRSGYILSKTKGLGQHFVPV